MCLVLWQLMFKEFINGSGNNWILSAIDEFNGGGVRWVLVERKRGVFLG